MNILGRFLLKAMGIKHEQAAVLFEEKQKPKQQQAEIIKRTSVLEQKMARLDKENEALGGTPLNEIFPE